MGVQVRQLFQDIKPSIVWKKIGMESIEVDSHKVLGRKRADNCMKLGSTFLNDYGRMGCNMPLTTHFLDSCLQFLSPNCGKGSNERWRRFNQDIFIVKKVPEKIEPISACRLLLDIVAFCNRVFDFISISIYFSKFT